MQKTPSYFGGPSATVSNNGRVHAGPGFTHEGDRDRARIAELERRLARLEAREDQRFAEFKEWRAEFVRQVSSIIKRNNKDEVRWADFLKQTEAFAQKIYAWQNEFKERFETTDALTHDVASHLFPGMKQFVDDVDAACAPKSPKPPKAKE